MKYMRQSRQWSPQSRAKLSASLQGVPKRPQHKAKISQSMKNYWQSVPLKVGTIVEPEQANQPVPPEPRIVTDHGILERIVREVLKELDNTTYQGKENVKNVNNK